MSHENDDIDERIKKQQEIIYELDKHYQECTLNLIKQVEQLEQMVNDLKQSNSNSNTKTNLSYTSNITANSNDISLSILPDGINPNSFDNH
ncbi:hypothetical protein M9Y10_028496 [Tritrichomonas musculus]|uniref:Uncharacterized protein n=1 Tax=Tritrichomonas musculus TaxID=1915356 RepID=A0ABR2KKG3_9EUKA